MSVLFAKPVFQDTPQSFREKGFADMMPCAMEDLTVGSLAPGIAIHYHISLMLTNSS